MDLVLESQIQKGWGITICRYRHLLKPGMFWGVTAWRVRKVIMWSFSGESWTGMETPSFCKHQNHGMPAQESCKQGVATEQERELCFRQQSWEELEIWIALLIRHEHIEVGICTGGFQSFFGQVFPRYAPSFWNGNVYFCHCISKYIICPLIFDFTGAYS